MAGPPDRERWRQLETLLDGALELEGAERETYLADACRDDPELREEVEALLLASEKDLTLPELADIAAVALERSEPLVGEQIGPYRIERLIGRGGMGEVFEAVDSRLGRRVAIKLLPARGRAGGERFLREARAASALDHPNICTIHDIGRTETGDPYLVMAYYRGQTLEDLLASGPLPIEAARELARQVGQGLEQAHRAGIVHRDIKPANILITEDGVAKILDFGIARLLGEESLTQTGAQLGTPAYMSPEQARGEDADPRTDVWALGLLLYEMIGGERPFAGERGQAVIHAILNRDPEPLSQRRKDVPEDLERAVARALSRDPARRPATMAEMVAALDPEVETPGSKARRPWRALAAMVVFFGMVAAVGWWVKEPSVPAASSPAVSGESERAELTPSRLAVFRFRNLSADPELEWLSEGIAELLLASLSQSSEIAVVSSGRLARVSETLGLPAEPDSDLPLDVLQRAAEGGEFNAAVSGSFARAGTALRIVLNVRNAADGEILKSVQVDGTEEASLFSMIDELSAAMRTAFEPRPSSPVVRVQEITTASLEAWRFYTEALALDREGKRQEAITLLHEAARIDPSFALAWVALGKMAKNLGQLSEARELTQRAVDNAERLPPAQRYEVVGAFHATRWSTLGLAAEAYEAAVRLRPEKETPRNNLAKIYTDLERYPEAEREYRYLIDAGTEYLGTYTALANTYAGMGRFETGYQLLLDFGHKQADNWLWHFYLGWHLTEMGRLEEALGRLEEAARRRPGEFFIHYARWRTLVLLDRGDEAMLEARRMSTSDKPFERWRGNVSEARLQTLQGDSSAALTALDAAIRSGPSLDASTALARCWKAELLLARGDSAAALVEAQRAIDEGEGEWPELLGRFYAALAHQQLGESDSANDLVLELKQLATRNPNRVEERQIYHLEGLLAEARGDLEGALKALKRAEALLPPEGVEFHWHVYPHHVPIWQALGRVELAAGRPAESAAWLERAITCGAERLESPLAYVRGLYLSAESHRLLGREAEARQRHQSFLEYWRSGDLDRARVERAMGSALPESPGSRSRDP